MTRTVIGSALGTVVAAGVIVGALKVVGPVPLSISQVTTNKESSFDVTGEGEVTTAPDRADINLGIQANEITVKAAQDKGNAVMNTIKEDLAKMGIEKADIKTINYNLYPNYDYRTGGQKITGYALNVSLQVKVKDFTKINQVVDTATADGANQVGGITFTLSDEKKKEIEDQVREAAVKEAKAKAESLSRLAGVRLGRIINVRENTNSNYPVPMTMYAKDAALSAEGRGGAGGVAGAPTNVEPGSTTYSMTVTLSYETL